MCIFVCLLSEILHVSNYFQLQHKIKFKINSSNDKACVILMVIIITGEAVVGSFDKSMASDEVLEVIFQVRNRTHS